ncbi:MAG: Rrf2 family transcriptional regulator [Phycisphaeraceae bacterium]
MLISQTAEYALRAAVTLADGPDRPWTTQAIAAQTRIPAGYLSKVLQALARADLVRGQRGLGGGFTLTREPGDISVLDVINAVDPMQRIHTCPLKLAAHGKKLCPLHRKLDDAMAYIEKSFRETSLAEILAEPSTSKPFCDEPVTLSVAKTGR